METRTPFPRNQWKDVSPRHALIFTFTFYFLPMKPTCFYHFCAESKRGEGKYRPRSDNCKKEMEKSLARQRWGKI